jgi:uncharacterized protein (TIGR03000 family)
MTQRWIAVGAIAALAFVGTQTPASSASGLIGCFNREWPYDYGQCFYFGHGYSMNVSYGYGLPFNTAGFSSVTTFPTNWDYFRKPTISCFVNSHPVAPDQKPADVKSAAPAILPASLTTEQAGSQGYIEIQVPAQAELWFDTDKTKQTGTLRTFWSPPLPAGQVFIYQVRARWNDHGKTIEQTQPVLIQAGAKARLQFTSP